MTVAAPADSPAGPAASHPAGLSTLALALLAGLVLVLISGFLALVLTGHDTATYALFVAGPLVTTFVGAVINHGVKQVKDVVRVVESQTNGLLSASLRDIHEHLDEQTQELLGESAVPVVVPAGSSGPSRIPSPALPVL